MSDLRRPNILFIITDQQFAGAMSCAGNKDLKTPGMDSLAESGTRFERAYCAQSLCVPSRTSIFTGRMPHENGVTVNCIERDTVCLPMMGTIFNEAGYDTGYFGKWHIALPFGNENAHGFQVAEETVQSQDKRVPEACARFIRRERDKPFIAVASFVNPHDICQFARGEELPQGAIPPLPEPERCPELPPNFQIPEHEPDILRTVQAQSTWVYPTINWRPEQWRQYRWAYYRLIEMVDGHICRLLKALKESGKEENTLVVFTSDHGDGHGAHRWSQKQALYEEPTRVPLIASLKGVTPGGRVDAEHLVSTGLDILPTLCDFAGMKPSVELAGRSIMAPASGGEVQDWRDHLVVETTLYSAAAKDRVAGRMLRSNTHKYIVYAEGELHEQLFDLANDPGETDNLAVKPECNLVLESHRRMLIAWCRRTRDPFLELLPGILNGFTLDDVDSKERWFAGDGPEKARNAIGWLKRITGKMGSELAPEDFQKYALSEVLREEPDIGR